MVDGRFRVILAGRHIDADSVHSASNGEWGDLLKSGVEIDEYEASLNVYDGDFAERMSAVFERDLEPTKPFTSELWLQRSFGEKFIEQVLRPIKSQL